MLRPRSARWFEIVAARDDATLVLEALARTGAVELEARASAALPPGLAELEPLLARFQELQVRYHTYWPAPADCAPSRFPEPPLQALQRCLVTITAWAAEAEPEVHSLQEAEAERAELALWRPLLPLLRQPDGAALAGAGPWLDVRLIVLPTAAEAAFALSCAAVVEHAATRRELGVDRVALLLAAPPAPLAALVQIATTLKGSVHAVPHWLQSDAAANAERLELCSAQAGERADAARARLADLQRRHELPRVLGDAYRLHWMLRNVHALESGPWLCRITGWSSDTDGEALARTLQGSGARALLHYAEPPRDALPPVLLDNPRWARPFEVFARALGMPAARDVDPSPVLAVAVPLMFGYMFGDVGQGLVIAAIAAWFDRRSPVARLLLVGGLSAACFGWVFGSLFSLHGVLHPLWLHPLDDPLAVLAAPLVFGAVLLVIGLALDGLQAAWRGALGRWLASEAALVPLYAALLAAPLDGRTLWLALAALVWCCAGHAWSEGRFGAAGAALGDAIEKALQLLINTLSFARVGAFALAHAGLSSAIVALVDAADSGVAKALVLVLGNALVIVLEAMVVSIQTTRLVLFEFFTRFMRGQGRAFRPLPPPPYTLQEG